MYKAVIFDMNGVLINDERIHQEAWRQFIVVHGFQISEDEFTHSVFGRTEKDVFTWLFKKELSDEEVNKYSNERVDIAISIFRPQLKSTPGLLDFLIELRRDKIKIGIATSSRNRYKDFILDGLSIREYFDIVVGAEDIKKGKPDPEIYLLTAQRLQVSPNDCLVFEDSNSGIISAKAAGMIAVGITTTHTSAELKGWDFVISSFEGISINKFM